MRIKLILLFLVSYSLVFSLGFYWNDNPQTEQMRSGFYDQAQYHNNLDEQHWFGIDRWAVKYDFNTYLAGQDSCSFRVSGARVYIPVGGRPLTVEVRTGLSQPDSIKATVIINSAATGWNDIVFSPPFDTTRAFSVVWLVITYDTYVTNSPQDSSRFMSACVGSGENSYFYNPNYEAYTSMASTNYQSEFLFTLKGHFKQINNPIYLEEFKYIFDPTLERYSYFPVFKIKNISSNPVSNVYLRYNLSTTANSSVVLDTVFMITSLAPNQEVELDSLAGRDYMFQINKNQYLYEAEVFCDGDTIDYNLKKARGFINRFGYYYPIKFVQNFLSSGNDNYSENILEFEEQMSNPEYSIINYYPEAGDDLFTETALWETAKYRIYGTPSVVINGTNKITGYTEMFEPGFNAAVESAASNETYLDMTIETSSLDSLGIVKHKVKLSNRGVRIFSYFQANVKLHAKIIEKKPNTDFPWYYINSSITDTLGIPVTVGFANTQDTLVIFNKEEITSLFPDNLDNCRLLLYIQDRSTKAIYGLMIIDYTDLVPTMDPTHIPVPEYKMTLGPTPFNASQNLKINLDIKQTVENIEINIYNIKGQRVKQLFSPNQNNIKQFTWDGTNEKRIKAPSGVYLIQAKIKTKDNKTKTINKTCIMLK